MKHSFLMQRYSIRSEPEELTADKFEIAGDAKSLQIRNLGSNDTNATLSQLLENVNQNQD